jgi:hypothetical protein
VPLASIRYLAIGAGGARVLRQFFFQRVSVTVCINPYTILSSHYTHVQYSRSSLALFSLWRHYVPMYRAQWCTRKHKTRPSSFSYKL